MTPDQTAGLTITPPPDDASDFVLNASATSQDIDPDTGAVTTETTVVAFDVAVTGVAEEPIVTVTTDAGFEDAAIDLNISVALPVEGGTQAITEVVISGVPEGAQLSAGTDNGDGTWTLARSDLSGLQITPPENSSDDMTLTVTATATATDIDPDTGAESTATSNLVFDVAITGVADVPQVTIADAVGAEDSAIPLDIGVALADLDGSETITDITVSGVPAGAELSAGTDNGDGTWTLAPAELSGLSVTPPANSDAEFSLTVTATATEADGDSATAIVNLDVTVTSVADAPTVAVTDVTGDEDSTIPLDIGVALADADGSESITNITISGVPAGAQLSAGTDNGDGTWTLLPGNLPGLTIDPLADSADDFVLTVSATSTDTDGDSATTVSTLNVTVTGVADIPTAPSLMPLAPRIPRFNWISALRSTTLMARKPSPISRCLVCHQVPSSQLVPDNLDGTWTLTPAQLAGLTITPPDDSDADFTLSVSATSTEAEGDAATTLANLDVTVTGVADASTVNVVAAAGAEDSAIALDIGVALNDVDGSESITDITVSGVPAGAQLSADGTWTLTPADLVGLTVTPPDDSDADFTLTVSATSTEAEDDSATTLANLDVTVTGVADVPTVTVADVTGGEDTAIALDIGVALNDVDGSESITDITVSGVPTGAQLSAGTDNLDGTWTLTPAQLTGLTVTPPADFDVDFTLTVSATSTEVDGDTATTLATLDVTMASSRWGLMARCRCWCHSPTSSQRPAKTKPNSTTVESRSMTRATYSSRTRNRIRC